jgi:hypothetical protein
MDSSALANFTIFITDVFIGLYALFIAVGLKNSRIYFSGEWYTREKNKSQFIQAVLGYSLLLVTALYFRFVSYPGWLFQYL